MRCDDARPLLLRGANPPAEDHLEHCDACFAWLEEHDPIAGLVRASRPAPVAPPASLRLAIVRRWQPRRVSIPLGIAAAVGLAGLMLAAALAAVVLQPAAVLTFLAALANVLEPVLATILTILAVPRALLLDNTAILALYVAVTIAICAAWIRFYQHTAPRRITS